MWRTLHLNFLSSRSLFPCVHQTCQKNRSIRVVVLSHVSSCTAIVFPVAKIAKALSELGVVVAVDGAHAPAQLELNLVS